MDALAAHANVRPEQLRVVQQHAIDALQHEFSTRNAFDMTMLLLCDAHSLDAIIRQQLLPPAARDWSAVERALFTVQVHTARQYVRATMLNGSAIPMLEEVRTAATLALQCACETIAGLEVSLAQARQRAKEERACLQQLEGWLAEACQRPVPDTQTVAPDACHATPTI